jgi:APA family basic amino acid/polyamine antiporter
MVSQLLRTKSPDLLVSEAESPERKMKRTLSALDLTALGIGAIIGAGIFSLIGTAAAGESFASRLKTPLINFIIAAFSGNSVSLGRPGAGPALIFSLALAAIACAFSALCYAELASMIPVAGSAYTYAYATLGELVAWIIGWDLILEYAVGNMGVAISWSGYFVKLIHSLTGLRLPLWLVTDHATATSLIEMKSPSLSDFSSTTLPVVAGHEIALNIPALLIVLLLTGLLVYGIQESARANTTAVIIKTAILIFFIAYGAFYINPGEWHPFVPNGFPGIMTGSAIIFFAFIGFDAVSTTA